MVYGACFCPLSNEEDLTNLGCDDSKVLKEEQREKLFSSINEITPDFMGWIITILSPNYLSTSMLSRFVAAMFFIHALKLLFMHFEFS